MRKRDLTGQRFGRLVVVRETDQRGPDGGVIYECLCDCGNTCLVWNNRLTAKGHSRKRSCGCLHDETHPQHGGSKTTLFHKWTGMQDRCYNPNAKQFVYYGARGITVCEEWRSSFEAFRVWAFANGYKEGLSLDRIDPDGNYSPDNCRWITMAEQQRNKRSCIYVEKDGQRLTLAEWCNLLDLPYKTIHARITRYHWEPEKALTTPIKSPGQR